MSIDIDERKVARNEFGLWLGWTMATFIGMLFGLLPFLALLNVIELGWARLLIPIWAGFMVGLFQWLVLRRYLTHSADWILNGGAGWSLGFALGLLVIHALSDSPLGALVGYIAFGIILGVLQWPVLRREIPNALPWIVSNMFGWALGAYLSQALLNLLAPSEPFSQVISSAVITGGTGLIAGAITGAALIWIVRQPDRLS